MSVPLQSWFCFVLFLLFVCLGFLFCFVLFFGSGSGPAAGFCFLSGVGLAEHS